MKPSFIIALLCSIASFVHAEDSPPAREALTFDAFLAELHSGMTEAAFRSVMAKYDKFQSGNFKEGFLFLPVICSLSDSSRHLNIPGHGVYAFDFERERKLIAWHRWGEGPFRWRTMPGTSRRRRLSRVIRFMKIVLKASEDILGHAESSEARTDPPMGSGEAPFYPTDLYSRVEGLFRRRSLLPGIHISGDAAALRAVEAELSKFHLALMTDEGEPIPVVGGFTIFDYRQEVPDEPLYLEFCGIDSEQFERLFPGHYQAYVDSFKKS